MRYHIVSQKQQRNFEKLDSTNACNAQWLASCGVYPVITIHFTAPGARLLPYK